MAKSGKTVFFCKECGYESSKWMGVCPGCREVGTFVEELVKNNGKQTKRSLAMTSTATRALGSRLR